MDISPFEMDHNSRAYLQIPSYFGTGNYHLTILDTDGYHVKNGPISLKNGPNSLFFPVIDGFQPRPDSSKLSHPPPSLANCGTAETDEIFRAVGGVLQDQVSPETRYKG